MSTLRRRSRHASCTWWACALILATSRQSSAADETLPVPLVQAHAHNDYLHERPLLDALQHGFTSVEADVYLVDGQLLVAHTRSELKPHRTLRRLYLDPLRERARQTGGRLWPNGPTLTLLIDIKADGD